MMHKEHYASGFLLHPLSQQILLQQKSSPSVHSSPWFLFGGVYPENEEPEAFFKNIIFSLLDIKIDAVHQIYSYLNENAGTDHVIVYSEVKSLRNFSPKDGLTFAWFTFKDVLKLQITEQTKHDIIVGQRVIDAASRKLRGEHTFQ